MFVKYVALFTVLAKLFYKRFTTPKLCEYTVLGNSAKLWQNTAAVKL